MRAVAFDTSTQWGGVALVERIRSDSPSDVTAEVGLCVRDSHSVHLLRLLERLMEEAGWPRGSVDVYAATRGPGSFTGIRVGLGTVKGLSMAAGCPAIGVVTLEAMAEAAGPLGRDRAPALEAGRGEVFAARYDARSSPPAVLVEPWLGPIERVLEPAKWPVPVVFGRGADAYWERLVAAGYPGQRQRSSRSVAAAAGSLALERLRGDSPGDIDLSPVYLRPPDALLPKRR